MVSVPLDQIRPHVLFALLFAKGERSNFWTLLVKLESEQAFYGHSVVLKGERTEGTENRGAQRFSEVYGLIRKVAEEIGIPVDTAVVGLGLRSLPAATSEQSVATLVTWRIGQPSSLIFSEKRGDWTINMER